MRLRPAPAPTAAAGATATATGTDRCPRCGGGFDCGVAGGRCWCSRVTLSESHRRELAASFDGCLCPACLRELQAGAPGA